MNMEGFRRSLRRRLTLLGMLAAGCAAGFFSETVMLTLVLAAGAQLLVCVAVKLMRTRVM